jgi:6-phosphogluconolactonase
LPTDADAGVLAEIQTITTLPEECREDSYAAAIHVHPAGQFLYASNRGHDSIAIFRLDSTTGRLNILGHQPTRGMWPRSFGIDGSGRFLFSANQKSDTIVSFHIDADTGELTPIGTSVCVPTPVCVLIAEL